MGNCALYLHKLPVNYKIRPIEKYMTINDLSVKKRTVFEKCPKVENFILKNNLRNSKVKAIQKRVFGSLENFEKKNVAGHRYNSFLVKIQH